MARQKTKLRQTVEKQANGLCEYCQSPSNATTEPFVIEHIVPKSKDGSNELTNLALACTGCNGHKYNKIIGIDPETKKNVILFHPRQQNWKEHFEWSKDSVLIIGKTPVGRATIDTLYLNRKPLQVLRRAFVVFGIHPPQ